jgi:hypothetical protein
MLKRPSFFDRVLVLSQEALNELLPKHLSRGQFRLYEGAGH